MNLKQFKQISITDVLGKSKTELMQLVKAGAKLLNPKINTLYRYGAETGKLASDAYENVMSSGGLFSVVREKPFISQSGDYDYTKTRNELLKELAREIRFANMKTSTLAGARSEMKRRRSIIEGQYDPEVIKSLSDSEINQLVSDAWDEFHRYREQNMHVSSTQLLDIFMTSNRTGEVLQKAIDEIEAKRRTTEQQAFIEAADYTGFMPEWDL